MPKKKRTVRKSSLGSPLIAREARMLYCGLGLWTKRGKPIKIAADFDIALDALLAVPSKKRRKAGRP